MKNIKFYKQHFEFSELVTGYSDKSHSISEYVFDVSFDIYDEYVPDNIYTDIQAKFGMYETVLDDNEFKSDCKRAHNDAFTNQWESDYLDWLKSEIEYAADQTEIEWYWSKDGEKVEFYESNGICFYTSKANFRKMVDEVRIISSWVFDGNKTTDVPLWNDYETKADLFDDVEDILHSAITDSFKSVTVYTDRQGDYFGCYDDQLLFDMFEEYSEFYFEYSKQLKIEGL